MTSVHTDEQSIVDGLATARVLPVVVLERADDAQALGAALLAGGLTHIEVTLRTAAAFDVIATLAADPRLTVGAGTVLRPDQVDRVVAAGARFVVSPGLSAATVTRAGELGVPVFPGVATATEIMAALDLGVRVLKLFPVEPLGGPAVVRALAAPFPGVRFIPTGGVGPATLERYLTEPAVLAVGGSWMVAPALLAARDWSTVTTLTAATVATVGSTC